MLAYTAEEQLNRARITITNRLTTKKSDLSERVVNSSPFKI